MVLPRLDHHTGQSEQVAALCRLFLLEGVPTIFVGLLIWARLASSPAEASFLTPAQQTWLVNRSCPCCCTSNQRLCMVCATGHLPAKALLRTRACTLTHGVRPAS